MRTTNRGQLTRLTQGAYKQGRQTRTEKDGSMHNNLHYVWMIFFFNASHCRHHSPRSFVVCLSFVHCSFIVCSFIVVYLSFVHHSFSFVIHWSSLFGHSLFVHLSLFIYCSFIIICSSSFVPRYRLSFIVCSFVHHCLFVHRMVVHCLFIVRLSFVHRSFIVPSFIVSSFIVRSFIVRSFIIVHLSSLI